MDLKALRDKCGAVVRIQTIVWAKRTKCRKFCCDEIKMYRVIHKSLRDFRPLRYSSRDGHAEVEHVNRKRDTPSFCPTLQVLDMLTYEGS